jgi:hypothetical protein
VLAPATATAPLRRYVCLSTPVVKICCRVDSLLKSRPRLTNTSLQNAYNNAFACGKSHCWHHQRLLFLTFIFIQYNTSSYIRNLHPALNFSQTKSFWQVCLAGHVGGPVARSCTCGPIRAARRSLHPLKNERAHSLSFSSRVHVVHVSDQELRSATTICRPIGTAYCVA